MHEPSRRDGFQGEVIAATPGGESLLTCIQCGTCGGSCPSGADMDHTPRQLFAMINAGLRQDVLHSNTPWYCVSCYYCTVRCPKEIPITELMYTLKRMGPHSKLAIPMDRHSTSTPMSIQASCNRVSPTCTASPSFTRTADTVPPAGERTSVSIFIASSTTITSPAFTSWPGLAMIF